MANVKGLWEEFWYFFTKQNVRDAYRDQVEDRALRQAVAKLRANGYAEAADLIDPDKQS